MQLMGDFGRGISEAFRQVDAATQGVSSGTFTVNQHNILAAARIIDSQADSLFKQWKLSRQDMRVEPPGTDDVSKMIAPAWNDILIDNGDSYAHRVADYITGLRNLADQLRDTAKSYGYTEGQIEAAFRGKGA